MTTVALSWGDTAIVLVLDINGDEGILYSVSATTPAAFNSDGDVCYYRGDKCYVPPFDLIHDQFYDLDSFIQTLRGN